MVNINTLIPETDVILITLDSLRYDAAQSLFLKGHLPHLSKWLPKIGWEERYTPASFTFPAHHAFFSGFLPTKIKQSTTPRLFASKFYGSKSTTINTFTFDESNLISALAERGYSTVCIGGVGFFNKQTDISSIFPEMFQYSEWSEKFGVTDPRSTEHQFKAALPYLSNKNPLLLFINVSATHQPNYFYTLNQNEDNLISHKAALAYIDTQILILQKAFSKRDRNQFIIVCSDHGTAYGEDGYWGHQNGHETVMKVPYLEYLNKRS